MKLSSFTTSQRLLKLPLFTLVLLCIGTGLSRGTYAEGPGLTVGEALRKAEKLVDGPVLAVHFDDHGDKPLYLVEYLKQGLAASLELDAKTGKQLKSKTVVNKAIKPQLSKALNVAAKQLEGEVESIEFEPKSGDYLLELKQDKGHSYVVIDGESFKLKAIDRSFNRINKHLNLLGGDEFEIEVFSSDGVFPALGAFPALDAENLHEMKSLNSELGAQLKKELAIICEPHAEKTDPAS